MTQIDVIVGCETSGVVREAFRSLGWDAWSVDILPADDGSPYHIQDDIRAVLRRVSARLGIFHPPCTRLANSGVRWLAERNLWSGLEDGAALFVSCLSADIPFIAVENPIPHKYALNLIGRKYDQKIQPWMFGHPESKATCLWLKHLPQLVATNVMDVREQRVHKLPPSSDRWKLRSKTYEGIAKAMADQWSYVL